ncbi:cactus-binding C-terminus of cactin protein-domain-containing protein [Limtongia smithiae]|uniref:cactus-binding C-terminus of cactin protein-domain-containing protein n=1 Tax=Limtongia smithiae TaxID=1125753 RepID=UPI0034CD6DE6
MAYQSSLSHSSSQHRDESRRYNDDSSRQQERRRDEKGARSSAPTRRDPPHSDSDDADEFGRMKRRRETASRRQRSPRSPRRLRREDHERSWRRRSPPPPPPRESEGPYEYRRALTAQEQSTKEEHPVSESRRPRVPLPPPPTFSNPHSGRPSARRGGGVGRMSIVEERQLRAWVAGEDDFALQQLRKGAWIRIREARARPLDWLVANMFVLAADEGKNAYETESDGGRFVLSTGAEMQTPPPAYEVVEGLGVVEVEGVVKGVTEIAQLETRRYNQEFWQSVLAICTETKRKLQLEQSRNKSESSSLHIVSDDIDGILRDKDYAGLCALDDKIEVLLSSSSAVDVDFWTALKKELDIRKARANCDAVHDDVARKLREFTQIAQLGVAKCAVEEVKRQLQGGGSGSKIEYTPDMDLLELAPAKTKTVAVSQEDFLAALEAAREKVDSTVFIPLTHGEPSSTSTLGTKEDDEDDTAERLFDREAARGTNDNEEIFNEEEELTGASSRDGGKNADGGLLKPRYFNRVQMGFDWNRYNQTHYSQDNPPPKIVQGYKFNIFYPELIDSPRAPTYKVIRDHKKNDGDNQQQQGSSASDAAADSTGAETCLIKFIAGAPYQDIAFRIVDRDWDYSSRRENGFRSSFDKGILQLHFRFKKIFYRK